MSVSIHHAILPSAGTDGDPDRPGPWYTAVSTNLGVASMDEVIYTLFNVEYSGQLIIIILLNDDCNLEGFSF